VCNPRTGIDMEDSTSSYVIGIIADYTGRSVEKISLSTIFEQIGLDEIEVVIEMMFELENEFRINIPDKEELEWHTVEDVVLSVKRLNGE
jgi:acyl carrier protein